MILAENQASKALCNMPLTIAAFRIIFALNGAGKSMSEQTNWVERRAAVEKSLATNSGTVWNGVRSAVQDACESYRKHYAVTTERQLTDTMENGNRLRIDLPNPVPLQLGGHKVERVITSIVISFNPRIPAIEWADNRGSHQVKISADEHEAFLENAGNRISPDSLSQMILERVLFKKD